MKKFYVVSADRVIDEEKRFSSALDSLLFGMLDGEQGCIDCFEFLDDDEIVYQCLWHREYLKFNNKLVLVESW